MAKRRAKRKGRYQYGSPEHRLWAAAVKKNHRGCVVCGRGRPGVRSGRPRKGQRLHAHHVYGTSHKYGVVLCPTCHKLVDLLAGAARAVFLNRGKWRKLLAFVRMKIEGPANCPGGKDCRCDQR